MRKPRVKVGVVAAAVPARAVVPAAPAVAAAQAVAAVGAAPAAAAAAVAAVAETAAAAAAVARAGVGAGVTAEIESAGEARIKSVGVFPVQTRTVSHQRLVAKI